MRINYVIKNEKDMVGLSRYSSMLLSSLNKKPGKQFSVKKLCSIIKIPDIIKKLCTLIGLDIENILANHPISLPKKGGIFHFTSQNLALPLLFSKRKCVVTIHDLAYLTKEYRSYSIFERLIYYLISKTLKRADRIIAISKYTKKEIIKYLDYPNEKIDVIPYGLDHSLFKASESRKAGKKSFNILFVGSEAPRKNLGILIRAIAELKKGRIKFKLIKVGDPQDVRAHKILLNKIKELDLGGEVIFKGQINDQKQLVKAYQEADLFVFPSLYEGFGLPPLEAMACGCPVVCSKKTAIPEVVGDAALFFNPRDYRDLANKIFKVLTDHNLKRELIKKGLKRARVFDWGKCAKETLRVYKKLKI